MISIRPKEVVEAEFNASKMMAVQKASPPCSIDGDHSWFRNPQYRISCSRPEHINISVVPLAASSEKAPIIGFHVLSTPKSVDQHHIWDLTFGHIVGTEAKESKVKGQEASLWKFKMDPKFNYHIIPHASKKASTGAFVLRVFSHGPLVMESMEPYYVASHFLNWSRPGSGEADSTGGPPMLERKSDDSDSNHASTLLENPKWGQNPQILVTLENTLSKNSVNLKFVLRRADKHGNITHEKSENNNISFAVVKPDFLREANMKKKKAGAVRENALGIPLPSKPTSLKLEKQSKYIQEAMAREDGSISSTRSGDIATVGDTANKRIVKKISLATDVQYFQTSGASKYDASLFFPSFPRQLMSEGIVVIPTLSDVGAKGFAILEVYSSEEVRLQQLPDKKMKVLADEWNEKTGMGSHINANWKKNPKFSLKFKPRSNPAEKFRICLHKVGEENWKKVNRLDHIGSMIGFYVFSSIRGHSSTIFESPYVPDREIATDDGFELEALAGGDDEYTIIPTTFSEGMYGSFVLSVMGDCDFTLAKKLEDKIDKK